jgi:hypothetical protein
VALTFACSCRTRATASVSLFELFETRLELRTQLIDSVALGNNGSAGGVHFCFRRNQGGLTPLQFRNPLRASCSSRRISLSVGDDPPHHRNGVPF